MDRVVVEITKEVLGKDLTESEEKFTHRTVERHIIGDIDSMLTGAGFTKVGTGRWSSGDTEVAVHAEDHPQTGKRLITRAEMVDSEGTTIGNISLPPIQIETTQYLQILTSLKDFISSRLMGKTESIDEGYEEYKKDPKFFDERRPGGKYVARKEDPKRGIKYVIVKKREADKIRSIPGGKPNKDGYLALWFVPAEYAKDAKWEVKRGNFAPIWDWGPGKRKGGFAEDLDSSMGMLDGLSESVYPTIGGVSSSSTPPQTGIASMFGNPIGGERVGLPVSKEKSGEGESLYPVEVTTVPKVGTSPQSGSSGRFGNEAQKLREAVLGKGGSKAGSKMPYPKVSGAEVITPPPETRSPGEAAGAPCGCDFDDETDRAPGNGKTRMEYPTVR